jgi:hypothetical protein
MGGGKPHQLLTIVNNSTMVRRKCQGVAERETLIVKAVLDVQSGKYKSAYHAVGSSVTRRVNGGLTRSQARQQQHNLSGAQETILLKWIKTLTISGYSPGVVVLGL